jgi:hypothetical protein
VPGGDDLVRAVRPPPETDMSRRGWLVPAGAAVAAILAAGTVGFATHRTPAGPAPMTESAMSGPESAAPGPGTAAAGPAGLIVREGDLVEASGPVADERMCSPAPALSGPCTRGIRVPGVAPAIGVTLRGRWHPQRLSDIEQRPYAPTSAGVPGPGPDVPDTPPCPAPAGGWRDGEESIDHRVHRYVHAHADRFAAPFATHAGNARVLVVPVVRGDVDQARTALTAIYHDNLCVVAAPGGRSIAADDKLQATTGEAVAAVMDDPAMGIYLVTPEDGRLRVNMIQLTRPLYDRLAAIGFDHLIIDPWIRPARR